MNCIDAHRKGDYPSGKSMPDQTGYGSSPGEYDIGQRDLICCNSIPVLKGMVGVCVCVCVIDKDEKGECVVSVCVWGGRGGRVFLCVCVVRMEKESVF